MCIICTDLAKQKLKPSEAMRNLLEMQENLDDKHWFEVFNKIKQVAEEEEKEEND